MDTLKTDLEEPPLSKAHVLLDSAIYANLKTYVNEMKTLKHIASIEECVTEAVEDYLNCTAPARLSAAKASFSARTVRPKTRTPK